MATEKFELDAIVELFGHQRVAGRVSEQSIGVATFIRIDIPETDHQPGFSRLVHPNAIYAINPVTEEVMKEMANRIHQKPIESWDIREMQKKLLMLSEKNKSESEFIEEV
ncbi:MAG: hypothetical protein DWQ44_00050 [Bacteroidetes bacterium]|nr:MAG: hypothetical protein DWQ33_05000 [Bacteroidota bacterium]REK06021.1 MAG: hypothetical protein DWQ39_04140 [Bacteroidota bacterium]REK37079.1 MAG: hypothetical protein DWQ44_00050 [Bacteroidota bacterium]REK47528.1 MAG: hypothetical protein DWQ48_12395 [Bacteroidota bacterium]